MDNNINTIHWDSRLIFTLTILFSTIVNISAQDTLSNGNALNIPTKKYGISIGNSYEFNGIRINFADNNVKRINGLNITFWVNNYIAWEHKDQAYSSTINGISIGVLPTGGTLQPINLGLFRVAAEKKLNGLSISGLNVRSNGDINGIAIGGLAIKSESVLSGISIAGFGIGGMNGINGLTLGGVGISSSKSNINGIAGAIGFIHSRGKINGLGISCIYITANTFNGLAIASITKTKKTNGLSVALYNKTEELHGVLLGLWNYAKNNPKGLKKLPLLNFHFGRNRTEENKESH